MASKEVMVSAPLMVLLFERTFIAGSLKTALRRSWPLYVGLAATWILLLIVSLRAPYGTAAGFGAGVPVHEWWLTQSKVLLMYLKLALWPWPLLIHYELPYFTTFAAVVDVCSSRVGFGNRHARAAVAKPSGRLSGHRDICDSVARRASSRFVSKWPPSAACICRSPPW